MLWAAWAAWALHIGDGSRAVVPKLGLWCFITTIGSRFGKRFFVLFCSCLFVVVLKDLDRTSIVCLRSGNTFFGCLCSSYCCSWDSWSLRGEQGTLGGSQGKPRLPSFQPGTGKNILWVCIVAFLLGWGGGDRTPQGSNSGEEVFAQGCVAASSRLAAGQEAESCGQNRRYSSSLAPPCSPVLAKWFSVSKRSRDFLKHHHMGTDGLNTWACWHLMLSFLQTLCMCKERKGKYMWLL